MNKNKKRPRPISQPIKKVDLEYPADKSIRNISIFSFTAIVLHVLFIFVLKNNDESYRFLNRTWGFNHVSYYPLPLIILFYTIAAIFLYKRTNELVYGFLTQIASFDFINFLRKYRIAFFFSISAICVCFFLLFKIKYPFLGDLDLRVDQTISKHFIREDYGTMYTFYYLFQLLHSLWHVIPRQAFVIGSAFSGGIFIFVSLLIANELGKNLFQKVVISLFSTAIGSTQFYFGYLEVYALPAAFFALYIYTCILCLKGKINIIFPIIVLAVTVWLHFLGIGLAPSLVVLAYKKYFYKWPVMDVVTTKRFVIFITCCLPLPYIIGPKLGVNGIMLQPSNTDTRFSNHLTLFSPVHIWEFINSQMLASGIGFFALLFITYKAIRNKIKFDAILWFLASASFFPLYITFITDSSRGSGDWDTMAFPAIMYSILVIYCFIYNYSNSRTPVLKYVSSILIAFNLLNLVTWVGINASDKSIKKIADMLETDPGTYYVRNMRVDMQLALMYRQNGLIEESHTYYNKILAKNIPDVRIYYNYALSLMEDGDTTAGIAIMKRCVEKFPFYAMPYNALLQFYSTRKLDKLAIPLVLRMFESYRQQPIDFDSKLGKQLLIQNFQYLYYIEQQNKNEKMMNEIQQCINKMQTKK